jgi:hypothetical protein
MTKDIEKDKNTPRSPVKVAQEAVEAAPPQSIINFDPAAIIMDKVSNELMNEALTSVRQNTLDAQKARSERQKIEEEIKLKALTSPVPSSSPLSPLVPSVSSPGGGLLSPIGSQDKAAIVDAALKNLSSDEAKVKWLNDHADWIGSSSSTLSGLQLPSKSKSPEFDVSGGSLDTLLKVLTTGMKLQETATSANVQQQQSQPQNSLDVIKVVDVFRQIMDAQVAQNKQHQETFVKVLDSLSVQVKGIQEDSQKAQAAYTDKLLALQKESLDVKESFMREKMDMLQDQLSRAPSLDITQLSKIITEARANNIPMTMETPDQARVAHQNILEEKALDHKIAMDLKKEEVALVREKRREAALTIAANTLPSLMDTFLLKKHVLSPAGSAIANKW